MHPFFSFRIAAVLAFAATTCAWTPPSKIGNRRAFLEKSIGASIVAGTAFVEPALAADTKIYQPDPHSLDRKVILVTGGSSGLGLESAKRLAAAGATTILTTRSQSKGVKAVAEVQSYLQEKSIDNSKVYFLTLDLDNLDSVRSFPQRYEALFVSGAPKIDVLMNNAGVAAIPTREVTKDGFERSFQSNHLGPFLLTSLLFPYLNQQTGARIINVASRAHVYSFPGLDLSNLNSEVEYKLNGWQSYSQSKLENILFSQELQRRADQLNMNWLTVSSLHPGVVGTDIWRTTYVNVRNTAADNNNPLQGMSSKIFYTSILSTAQGANTQVWLASLPSGANGIGRGQYFDEDGNVPRLAGFAKDKDIAAKLWERSEELLGVPFELADSGRK